MSHDELHALLTQDGAVPPPPELNESERWLMRHLTMAAAFLPDHAERYRQLLGRWEAEGPSEDLRGAALEAAGRLAVIMRSVRRRPQVLVAAKETPLSPTLALGALDQLLYSFTLLTSPIADDYSEARLTEEELDEMLEQPELQEWLHRIGADEAGI